MRPAETTGPEAPGQDRLTEAQDRLIDAALPHVVFDGWTETALRAAVRDTGLDRELARLAFPRGGIDMALAFHRRADRRLAEALDRANLESMRVRDRVAFCVRKRIELIAEHREAVRRGAALFALPQNAPEGMRALWQTADLIWNRCGDTATDYNWYTKRMILASVISATKLYWLGDQSTDFASTWAFLDRRIDDVMQFEKTKAAVERNPIARAVMWGPNRVLGMIRAPGARRGPAYPPS